MVQITPNVMPVYTYTGNHQMVDDGDGHWRIKFLSSGVLEWLSPDTSIDVFLVGGGGGGAYGPGGGGGYTKTERKVSIRSKDKITIQIGAGGAGYYSTDGGSSSFGNIQVAGGKTQTPSHPWPDGGSGGGSTGDVSKGDSKGGNGGTDGGNGEDTFCSPDSAGKGQGSTTREFGEPEGALYCGGGGGGIDETSNSSLVGKGGEGSPKLAKDGSSAPERYFWGGKAGGGYGGGGGGTYSVAGGSGAQGICIIRDARA